jgi:hypothetical protein
MARCLAGYLGENANVTHARELEWHGLTDIEWINRLRNEPDDWIVVTADLRIQKNKAERAAFRSARLRGIVLAPAFQKQEMGQACGRLVMRWDAVQAQIMAFQPPVLIELQFKGEQLRPLPL